MNVVHRFLFFTIPENPIYLQMSVIHVQQMLKGGSLSFMYMYMYMLSHLHTIKIKVTVKFGPAKKQSLKSQNTATNFKIIKKLKNKMDYGPEMCKFCLHYLCTTLSVLSISFEVDVPTEKVGGSLLFECRGRELPRGVWGHASPRKF